MVAPGDNRAHGGLIPKRSEVSAIARLPIDDPGTGTGGASADGAGEGARRPVVSGVWPGTAVVLCRAYLRRPCRGGARCAASGGGAAPDQGHYRVRVAAGMVWASLAGSLSGLGRGGDRALSSVSLVRAGQGGAQRVVDTVPVVPS